MVIISMKVVVTRGHTACIHTEICSTENDDSDDSHVRFKIMIKIVIITMHFLFVSN